MIEHIHRSLNLELHVLVHRSIKDDFGNDVTAVVSKYIEALRQTVRDKNMKHVSVEGLIEELEKVPW